MSVRILANNALKAAHEAMAQGDYDMARAALRWARRADSGNPLYIHAEAILAQRTGAHHEADRLFRRVADLAVRAFGAGHIHNVAVSARTIDLYEEMGRPGMADELRNLVIDGLDRSTAVDGSIHALDRLADICLKARRSAAALAIYESALARRRAVFGDGHARVSECLVALARLRARIRKLAETTDTRETAPSSRPEIVWRREDGAGQALSA